MLCNAHTLFINSIIVRDGRIHLLANIVTSTPNTTLATGGTNPCGGRDCKYLHTNITNAYANMCEQITSFITTDCVLVKSIMRRSFAETVKTIPKYTHTRFLFCCRPKLRVIERKSVMNDCYANVWELMQRNPTQLDHITVTFSTNTNAIILSHFSSIAILIHRFNRKSGTTKCACEPNKLY